MIKNDVLLSTPFVTVNVATSGGERGLAGVVLDPSFATNHYIYLYYTATTPTIHSRLSRFTANGDVAVAGSEKIILELDTQIGTVHNGGALKFWYDGTLFISTGDNTTSTNSQDLSNLLGKILRIDVRSDDFLGDPTRNYSIPTSNPFRTTAGARPEIWAYGLRNPWSMAIQRGTNRIFINDVGSTVFEEINEGVVGSNYGWPITEGVTTDPRFRSPIFTYNRSTGVPIGCAITGGAFYNPPIQKFPSQYLGKYFFSDYCDWWIYMLDTTTLTATPFATGLGNLSGIEVGLDGNLYYLEIDLVSYTSTVNRISYNGILSPQINSQPQDQVVSDGYPATFTVGADGDPPLHYQWQRNNVDISGSPDSPTYTLPNVQIATDNGVKFRCIVRNAFGIVGTRNALLTVIIQKPPTPTISSPSAGTHYKFGQMISFAGSATDPQDGTLPSSALTWVILFEHHSLDNPNHHTHPFFPPTSGITKGTVTLNFGETDADVWYRIFLTAVNSYGLSQTTFTDVLPVVTQLKITSTSSLFPVLLDGSPKTAPYTFLGVAGTPRTIGVTTPQVVNGQVYNFLSWSDGGALVHDIITPSTPTGYIANFATNAFNAAISASPNPFTPDLSGKGQTTLTWTSAGTTKVEVHINSPTGSMFAGSGPGTHSSTTGQWVKDGMTFYLQNVSNGLPLTTANTLATVTLQAAQ